MAELRKKILYRYTGPIYHYGSVWASIDTYVHAHTEAQALVSLEKRLHNEHQREIFLMRKHLHRCTPKPKRVLVEFQDYLSEIHTELWKDCEREEYYAYYGNRWFTSNKHGEQLAEFIPNIYFTTKKYY